MKLTSKLILATLCAVAVLGIGVANASSPAGVAAPAVIRGVASAPQAAVSNVPKLGAPKNGYANNKMPRFTWRKLKNAASYHLQVARDPGFTDLVINQDGLLKPRSGAAPFEYGVFYWHVQETIKDGSTSEWSEIRTYTITIMKSPKNGARTGGKPVWKWKKVPGASYYSFYMYAMLPSGSSFSISQDIPSKYSAAKWADTPFPSGTVIYWRVSANNTPAMQEWSFTVK